jgi:hypothetical protein
MMINSDNKKMMINNNNKKVAIVVSSTTSPKARKANDVILDIATVLSSDDESIILEESATSNSSVSTTTTTTTATTDMNTTTRPGILVFRTNDISIGQCPLSIQRKAYAIEVKQNNVNRRLQINQMDQLKVRFSDITIREYPYGMGDNPSSRNGPSLGLSWSYRSVINKSIDEHETSMKECRRETQEMIMPSFMRIEILKSAGYSRQEIVTEMRNLDKIRGQRQITVDNLNLIYVEEIFEKVARKSFDAFTFGRRKKREKQYIQNALTYHTCLYQQEMKQICSI